MARLVPPSDQDATLARVTSTAKFERLMFNTTGKNNSACGVSLKFLFDVSQPRETALLAFFFSMIITSSLMGLWIFSGVFEIICRNISVT